jgi:hypothetical protein
MRQSGKASVITILAIAAILVVVGLLAFSRESLGSVGGRFMEALRVGDVPKLTKLSYLGSMPEEEMRKQWDFAVNHAGKYYIFGYRITSSRDVDGKSGSVSMQVLRNPDHPGAYEEAFQLPMVKVGDEWKVDVRSISRQLYPGLPR